MNTQHGIDPAKIISREIRHFIHREDESTSHDRYERDAGWPTPVLFFEDIELLGSFPGGVHSAVKFLIGVFFDGAYTFYFGFRDAPFGRAQTFTFRMRSKKFDQSLCKLLQIHIQDCAQAKTLWDPKLSITNMVRGSRLPLQVGYFVVKTPDPTRGWEDLRREDVFPQSARMLAEWHAREYGKMMAQKVAGHLLPPELVELIEECFYSKSFLKSLGV